jgi:hypothetical protein
MQTISRREIFGLCGAGVMGGAGGMALLTGCGNLSPVTPTNPTLASALVYLEAAQAADALLIGLLPNLTISATDKTQILAVLTAFESADGCVIAELESSDAVAIQISKSLACLQAVSWPLSPGLASILAALETAVQDAITILEKGGALAAVADSEQMKRVKSKHKANVAALAKAKALLAAK